MTGGNLLTKIRQHGSTTWWDRVVTICVFPLFAAAIFYAVTSPNLFARAGAISVILVTAAFYARHNRIREFTLRASLENAARDHDEAVELAERDALTGLANRIAFNQQLREFESNRARARISVLFFDLNRFKDVNDTLGHKIGDLLLRGVADRLRPVFETAAVFARIGGDEFAAIIPADHPRPLNDWGQMVIDAISEPFAIEGHHVQVGTSIGASTGDAIVDGGDELLRRADLAMYEAKSENDSKMRCFDSSLSKKLSERRVLRLEMPNAMLDDQINVSFQPIFDSRTSEIVSAEALMRWRSPVLGQVSPAVAVPVAEESGQIVALTDLTLVKALDVAARAQGMRVGVNISPLAFRQPGFVDAIANHLMRAGLDSDSLYLEITEGVLISHMAQASRTIQQLREIGIEVYLDDFGTGFSSLSYLQHFELDGMKIDKSFLRNVGEQGQSTQIMRSVINLGHSLGMTVVAEGVENDWQARLLQLLTCDRLQGYHLAVPLATDEFLAFVKKHQPKQMIDAPESRSIEVA